MKKKIHCKRLLNLAQETGYDVLMEKLAMQDNYWAFPTPQVIAGEMNGKRILFEVKTLKTEENDYDEKLVSATGNVYIVTEGTVAKRLEDIVCDDISDDILPSEFIKLAEAIPDVHIDKYSVATLWDVIPEDIRCKDSFGDDSLVHFDKVTKQISVDSNTAMTKDESLLHMNRIAEIFLDKSFIEDAVKEWYQENDFDLPF